MSGGYLPDGACRECGQTGRHDRSCAAVHRTRIAVACMGLASALRQAAEAGPLSAPDFQLLAALDRWSAGDLT